VGSPRVLARVAGMAVAAVVVTAALGFEAIAAGTADVALLATLSVQGMAASAVLSAAWAFQDRRAMGRRLAVRCWTGVAVCLGLANACWLALAVPGPLADTLQARLTTAGATLALDTLLVAVPALLGARAAAQAPSVPSSVPLVAPAP
jgi:putative flippase GtrA